MTASLATVSYIGSTILFILSLGGLSNPETARRGNLFGIVGMAIAVITTLAVVAGSLERFALELRHDFEEIAARRNIDDLVGSERTGLFQLVQSGDDRGQRARKVCQRPDRAQLPQDRQNNTFQYADTLSWTYGTHSMKWGADVRHVNAYLMCSARVG